MKIVLSFALDKHDDRISFGRSGADTDRRLQAALERGNLVFVVGTGYSAATSRGSEVATWRGLIADAAADLDRAGLAAIPLTTMMTPQGVFAPRTSEKGRRFLAFINEPDSLAADPPASL